ncbi:MAG: hypothetical protein ABSE05_09465 [Syntrophales bacterium]
MIKRIPQRSKTDCAICTVSMVMGHPYTYERVLSDSDKYAKVSKNRKFLSWWEPYLRDEGFRLCYRPFRDLYVLPRFTGSVVGVLGIDIPHVKMMHIVAVDELGIIDPANNAPDHTEINEYIGSREAQGFKFHSEFLAIERREP